MEWASTIFLSHPLMNSLQMKKDSNQRKDKGIKESWHPYGAVEEMRFVNFSKKEASLRDVIHILPGCG